MKLQATIDGEQVTVEPQSVQALALVCRVPAGPRRLATTLLVLDSQVPDQEAFWTAWETLGGRQQGLVWDTGEEFRPPVGRSQTAPRRSWGVIRWLRRLLDWLDR